MRQFGRATIYGMNGASIFIYGYVAYGNLILNSAQFNSQFNSVPLLSWDGDLIGNKVSNPHATCTIEMVPVGGPGINTTAAANSMVTFPPPMALVRLTNFPGATNGYWNYAGNGTVRIAKDQVCIMTLPLVRYNSIDPRRLATIRTKS